MYLVFDVESIGLHGGAFAVGWVVVDASGAEQTSGYAACLSADAVGTDSNRAWVQANVPPLPVSHETSFAVRQLFWETWLYWRKQGAVLVADCGWPVEARFLIACIEDDPIHREWEGPYPLHDVATARLAAGLDPLGTVERLPAERPAHHPLTDARQSARLFLEALNAVKD